MGVPDRSQLSGPDVDTIWDLDPLRRYIRIDDSERCSVRMTLLFISITK